MSHIVLSLQYVRVSVITALGYPADVAINHYSVNNGSLVHPSIMLINNTTWEIELLKDVTENI